MIAVIRIHRSDHAEVVDHRRHTREDLADLDPALPVLPEFEWRSHQVARRAVRFDLGPGQRLAVVLGQHRLRIERIDVRHAAIQEQKDDALRFRREMRSLGRKRARRGALHAIR